MKEILLVLFLATLSSYNFKLLNSLKKTSNKNTNSLLRKRETDDPSNAFQPINFSRQGNITVQDIGSSYAGTWICNKQGKILKSSATPVRYVLNTNLTEECIGIDVDYTGLPWVVTKDGNVMRLKTIYQDSVIWDAVYKSSLNGNKKAIDIGCSQQNITSCYLAVQNSSYPYSFDGTKFVENQLYNASSNILKLDLGYGTGGEILRVINEDQNVLELAKNQTAISLGIKGFDISVSYANNVYVCNANGIFMKNSCSNFFRKVSDLYAQDIAVGGNKIWGIGFDDFVYNATLSSSLERVGC